MTNKNIKEFDFILTRCPSCGAGPRHLVHARETGDGYWDFPMWCNGCGSEFRIILPRTR